jgi:hypothetical protein
VDAHHDKKESQVFLAELNVTQAEGCLITVTVGEETHSGEHKFKVGGGLPASWGAGRAPGACWARCVLQQSTEQLRPAHPERLRLHLPSPPPPRLQVSGVMMSQYKDTGEKEYSALVDGVWGAAFHHASEVDPGGPDPMSGESDPFTEHELPPGRQHRRKKEKRKAR